MKSYAILTLLFISLLPTCRLALATQPSYRSNEVSSVRTQANHIGTLAAPASGGSSLPSSDFEAIDSSAPVRAVVDDLSIDLSPDLSLDSKEAETTGLTEESHSPLASLPSTAALCIIGGGLAGIAIMRRK